MKCCSEGVCNFVCVQKINDAIMKEYLDRVFSAISTNTELENLQPGIGEYESHGHHVGMIPTTAIIVTTKCHNI